ncbi:MAG: alanine--tRNA ligase [Armatimonadetes bacterium]|nr:alanine--tRNA ligase [Armatimonadota bacterium]
MPTVQEIRQLFLSFFEDRGHLVRPSAPLVLRDDATSLFTSAGMQPYMAAYRGEEAPPAPRVVSIQKCNRTVDIDGVGIHNRYCTFFEMLGNFSFGDYFKAEAVDFAWELFNDVLQLPRERLWFTVFTDDDETEEIWHKRIGIPRERILRFGRSDNFWPKARWEGPCGPCSEIHIDLGEEYSCGRDTCRVNCDCDRYLELWNLVFQMYTESPDGVLTPLPKPGVDTGMGLERLALVLQDKPYVAQTDEMWQICSAIVAAINQQRSQPFAYGDDAQTDLALRIMTDHLRAGTFIMNDGVVPSADGAGYVLRRFIRRAYRFGRQAGATKPFLHEALPAVAAAMGQAYPELKDKVEFSAKLMHREEERFAGTLESGMNLLEEIVDGLDGTVIPGREAFRLYDTYGFPLELTVELAAERNLTVDEAAFGEAMAAQRVRSRGETVGLAGSRDVELAAGLPATEFLGYETASAEVQAVAFIRDSKLVDGLDEGDEGGVVLDRTPFYAERGGQGGDTGRIIFADGVFEVTDTVPLGDTTLHVGRMASGVTQAGPVVAEVSPDRRRAICAAHTGTHLLHEALRRALGPHVDQSGSLVAPDRLRFDFTHHEAVGREVLDEIEDQVNAWVVADLPVQVAAMGFQEARDSGARALFTEKYGDVVRTVTVADVSMELCGGTHCSSTGQIGSVRILSESSIAAGVRRIEAVTGLEAVRHARHVEEELVGVARELGCTVAEVPARVAGLQARLTELQHELKAARQARSAVDLDSLPVAEVGGLKVVAAEIPGVDADMLSSLVDQIADKNGDGVTVLATVEDGKVVFMAKASDGAVKAGVHAGNLVKELATRCGGGGGGRPQFARAGGKDPAKLGEALAAVVGMVEGQVV